MKEDKSEIWLFSIFAIVGLGLIIGGVIATLSHIKYMETAEPVSAVISDIQSYRGSKGKTQYHVYVDYQYKGVEYDGIKLNYYSSGMYKGQSLDLLCDSNNPINLRAKGSDYFLQIALFFMGVSFFLVGFIPGMSVMKKIKMRKELLENGRELIATVEQIELNFSYSANHKHPYVIYCTYKDPFKDVTYRFKSGNVWGEADQYFPVGSEISVIVDPDDYSRHYVRVEV